MDMTEQQVYEALGVEQPQEEPEEQPQEEAQEQPAQEQPAEESTEESAGDPPEEQSPEQPEEPTREQTEQERRENAARRRQAELQAAVEQAVQAERERARKETAALLASAGRKNSLTGQPITNLEEFNSWKTAFDEAKLQRDLKAGKLTQEGLSQAIAANETVKRMAQGLAQADREKQQAQREAARQRMESELEQIKKLNPKVKTMDDVLKGENGRQFYDLVKRGNSFLDAYKLAHYDALQKAAADAARQQALTNARGKEHLKATDTPRGPGAVSVPPDELTLFRELMPGASDADIQAYYNQYKKP